MKLRWRIFLGFSLLIFATLSWGLNLSRKQLRPRYLEAIEDTLFDIGSYLGRHLSESAVDRSGALDLEALRRILERPQSIAIPAKIYGKTKDAVELRIYVTDAHGKVVFDSDGPGEVGKDYSRWNDVYHTLRGRYGARSTRRDPDDAMSSTLIVAAPIRDHRDRIVGVVSVGKPLESLRAFFDRAETSFFQGVLLLVGLSLAITFFISQALVSSLNVFSKYVQSLGGPNPEPMPRLGAPEIRELAEKFQQMKTALDGRAYVERYVTSLTHEIKSPLSGLLGATELIESKQISEADRQRLLRNIRDESLRLKDISEQILDLASLEKRSRPLKREIFDLVAILEEVEESLNPQLMARNIRVDNKLPDEALVEGERFLIWRALNNVVQNAVEFSPTGGAVRVAIESSAGTTAVVVEDEGPGLPEFVRQRLFEKFFSTERQSTGKRGTGLGLTFAKEVIEQHGGSIALNNRADASGARARIALPSAKPPGSRTA